MPVERVGVVTKLSGDFDRTLGRGSRMLAHISLRNRQGIGQRAIDLGAEPALQAEVKENEAEDRYQNRGCGRDQAEQRRQPHVQARPRRSPPSLAPEQHNAIGNQDGDRQQQRQVQVQQHQYRRRRCRHKKGRPRKYRIG